MMKPIPSIIKVAAICVLSFFLYNCEGEKYLGDFRFSDDARSFMINDTITKTFKMIDNHGMVDEYSNQPGYNYHYRYISRPYNKSQEQFMVWSISQLNNYLFSYELLADKSTRLTLGLYGRSEAIYDLALKTIINKDDPIPDVKFYDEMEVKGAIYHKIIEVDYSENLDKLSNDFPVKIYYSREKGLIKFIRKDGIYFERI